MNKRFLLNSLNRRSEDKPSDSSGTSLFSVIKRNTNAFLLRDFQSHSKSSGNNDGLRSIINSGKEIVNPLSRFAYKIDRLEILRSFTRHFNDKFGTNEPLGYISRHNSTLLLEHLDYFNKTLPSDIHIFTSEFVKFSPNVVLLKGVIDDKMCEFLLHKKRLKWFLRNFQVSGLSDHSCSNNLANSTSQSSVGTSSHPCELSQKVSFLINSKEPVSFTPERISFLLFDPMFLSNDIVITKTFMLIY